MNDKSFIEKGIPSTLKAYIPIGSPDKEYIRIKCAKKTLALITCLALGCLLSSYAQNIDLQTAQIGKAATVILTAKIGTEGKGNGSGFFIRPDLIVTNIHVVAGIYGRPISCSAALVNQSTQYAIKGVVASDPEHDLMILKVEGEGAGVLQLGDSDAVKLGEEVIAIGTHRKASVGIVKGTVARTTPHFFRVEGTLPSGYSGSSVLNGVGEVIGICVEGGESQSFGYIIPSNHLKALLKKMSTQEKSLEKWREEPFIRAYALVNQGTERMAFGNVKGAIQSYDAAIRLKPDFASAYTRRAKTKSMLRDYKGMVRDYDAAIHLGQDHVYAYINRGIGKRNLRNYSEAIKDYNIAIYLDPKYAAAYLNRGNVKSDLGDHKMAITDYDTAIHLGLKGTMLAIAYVKRAGAKSNLGDTKGTIDDLTEAIYLKPSNTVILTAAYLDRGLAKFNSGDAVGAIKDYDEVVHLKPKDAMLTNAYLYRANAKSKLGNNIGAIKDYDQIIRLSQENTNFTAFLYSKRASEKVEIGDNRGAIEDCNVSIRLVPDFVNAYKIRGDARSNLGDYAVAIEDYDTVVYLKPDSAAVYYKRGSAKFEIGNVPEAAIDFRTALKLAKWQSSQSLKDKIEKSLSLLQ